MTPTDTPPTITLTPEERTALYYIPQAPGGRVVSEELQQRLEDLGLAAKRPDGTRWLTQLGDQVRQGKR